MKKRLSYWTLSVLCLVVLALCVPGSVWADSITIANPSFEEDTLNMGQSTNGSIIGWQVSSNTAGAYHPSIGAGQDFTNPVPGPVNIGWASSATISQVLAATIQPNYHYELQVYVGTWETHTSSYTVQLLEAGTNQVLASASGTTPHDAFIPVNMEYFSGSQYIGQALKIALSSGYYESDFDKVTLNASQVPLPSALLLLASGLGGLAVMRRRFFL